MTRMACFFLLQLGTLRLCYKSLKALKYSSYCIDPDKTRRPPSNNTAIDYEILQLWTLLALHKVYVLLNLEVIVSTFVPFYYYGKMLLLLATLIPGTKVPAFLFDSLFVPMLDRIHVYLDMDYKALAMDGLWWGYHQGMFLPFRVVDWVLLPGNIWVTEEEDEDGTVQCANERLREWRYEQFERSRSSLPWFDDDDYAQEENFETDDGGIIESNVTLKSTDDTEQVSTTTSSKILDAGTEDEEEEKMDKGNESKTSGDKPTLPSRRTDTRPPSRSKSSADAHMRRQQELSSFLIRKSSVSLSSTSSSTNGPTNKKTSRVSTPRRTKTTNETPVEPRLSTGQRRQTTTARAGETKPSSTRSRTTRANTNTTRTDTNKTQPSTTRRKPANSTTSGPRTTRATRLRQEAAAAAKAKTQPPLARKSQHSTSTISSPVAQNRLHASSPHSQRISRDNTNSTPFPATAAARSKRELPGMSDHATRLKNAREQRMNKNANSSGSLANSGVARRRKRRPHPEQLRAKGSVTDENTPVKQSSNTKNDNLQKTTPMDHKYDTMEDNPQTPSTSGDTENKQHSLREKVRTFLTGDSNIRLRDYLFDLDLVNSPSPHVRKNEDESSVVNIQKYVDFSNDEDRALRSVDRVDGIVQRDQNKEEDWENRRINAGGAVLSLDTHFSVNDESSYSTPVVKVRRSKRVKNKLPPQ